MYAAVDQAPGHGAVLVHSAGRMEHSTSWPQVTAGQCTLPVGCRSAPNSRAVLVHIEHSDTWPQTAPNSRYAGPDLGCSGQACRWQWNDLPAMGHIEHSDSQPQVRQSLPALVLQ